jgi:hypothetical protein
MKGARVNIETDGLAKRGPAAFGLPDRSYDSELRGRVAFAVIVEHGGYGGSPRADYERDCEAAAD